LRATLLALFGIVAIVLIAGIILTMSSEKTGKIVTYQYTNPEGCYSSAEEACARNIRCETVHDAVPVTPQPNNVRPGYVACRCPNQLDNPNSYHQILMCQ
jgi:hypothetical protein